MKTITLSVGGVTFQAFARKAASGKYWWTADLRGAGFARHQLGIEALPGSEPQAAAVAGELLTRLRGGQKQLALGIDAPTTVAGAIERALEAARFKSAGTRLYFQQHAARIYAEMAGVMLADLVPPAGNKRLRDYRDNLRARGLKAHTVQQRWIVLRRGLKFAKGEGWIPELPEFPRPTNDGEPIYVPTCRPVSAGHYAAVHAAMLPLWRKAQGARAGGTAALRAARGAGRVDRADALARRLLYLDFIRYTGAHKHDADTLAGAHVSPEFGTFLRRNIKNSRVVEAVWVEMPPPLAQAMAAEYARRGGYIGPDELICGTWRHPSREIAECCKRLGIPAFTLLDLRCTVATELASAGVPEHVAVLLLGHTSSRMVREVYRKVPRAELSAGMRAIGRHKGDPTPSRVLNIRPDLTTVPASMGSTTVRRGPESAAPPAPANGGLPALAVVQSRSGDAE